MNDNDFKLYILNQLICMRDALLDSEYDHKTEIAFNLGVLVATIDRNIDHDNAECA
jgi:hypothetical protein